MKTNTLVSAFFGAAVVFLGCSSFAQSGSLNGSFQLAAGQAEECFKTVLIDRVSEAGYNRTVVKYGDLVQDKYADQNTPPSYKNFRFSRFDSLGFCKKQTDGRIRWHSQAKKQCVTKDSVSEFTAIDKDIYAPWMAGKPDSFQIRIVRSANPGLFEITMTNQGVGPTCVYTQGNQGDLQ